MLQEGHVSQADIKLSWWPTRLLPEDTFLAPVLRIDASIEKDIEIAGYAEEGRRLGKSLVSECIGHLVSEDEPVHYKYFASTDPQERPPNSMLLPFRLEPWGVYEWAQRIEKRSYDSVRPIHSMVMQVAHLRMNLLARYLRRTLVGWRPCNACQARRTLGNVPCPRGCCPTSRISASSPIASWTALTATTWPCG